MQIAVEEMKQHLQVDFDDDDALIEGYLSAGETHVVDYLRRDLDTEFPDGWPAPIKLAVMLLVGHWYANRASVAGGGQSEIPLSTKSLLAPYRNFA